MSEKNGAASDVGALLQKICSRLDGIEQRQQRQEAIEALGNGDGTEAARMNPSDEPRWLAGNIEFIQTKTKQEIKAKIQCRRRME